jgi:glutamate-1-semialdehyde aminotransferase
MLLSRGVSIAPSAFEAMFVSTEHSPVIVEQVRDAFDHAFQSVREFQEKTEATCHE